MALFDFMRRQMERGAIRGHQLVEAELDKKLAHVDFFPESLEAYEKFVRYPVEVIDTGNRDKGVAFENTDEDYKYRFRGGFELKKYLVDQKIAALVDCRESIIGRVYRMYGLPVAKAKNIF